MRRAKGIAEARSYHHAIFWAIIGLGALERAIWSIARPSVGASGEAARVAAAVANGQGFADAYRVGQGATAHLLPISPGWAGLVYSILGVNSRPAEFVLASYSIGLALGTYIILHRAFGILGVARWPRLGALAFGCIAPAYLGQEAVDFRVWEGGLAVFLSAAFLLILIDAGIATLRQRVAFGSVLAAVLFFVNPPLGIAAFFCAAVFALRKLSLAHFACAALYSIVTLACLVGSWTWRNERVMHAPILLRSNAGLELALANYPGALEGKDRRQQFLDRIGDIHPSMNNSVYQHMQRIGGEVVYAKQLGAQAKQWMAAHPETTSALFVLHLRQMLVPQKWQFDVYGRTFSPWLRALLADLAGAFGLIGLILAVRRRDANWIYPAVIVLVPAFLVAPFQPVPRYTYIIYPTLVFCAAELAERIWTKIRPRVGDVNV